MLRLFNRRPDIRTEFVVLGSQDVTPEQIAILVELFSGREPRDLYHVNPRLIGERLGMHERATLRVLTAALQHGLVTLHWDVRCPMCGSINHRGNSLTALHHTETCEVCSNVFANRFDEEVRVTFSLHERLDGGRAVNDPAYRAAIDARLGVTSGHTLMVLPEFQQLFPQQRLLPDESLDVTRATLLFTDLAGSTAIYARRGDPRAYHLVRLHFDELFRVADENGGVMVKTIGDAVMAAFLNTVEGLQAALDMQVAVAELNRRSELSGEERLILKIGLHSGPCLAVTLNDRPDYFGTTVNIAARVQGLSKGNDIVFTEAVRNDLQTRDLLADRVLESHEARLRGLDDAVLVHRFEV
ncbi:MAG: adenylate/guanylate cyclase domain-containing protein [Oscillochloris sp.]|nr:adenylate/guanylate cyclase domain-containing protein [Oscillochloris sp.]